MINELWNGWLDQSFFSFSFSSDTLHTISAKILIWGEPNLHISQELLFLLSLNKDDKREDEFFSF